MFWESAFTGLILCWLHFSKHDCLRFEPPSSPSPPLSILLCLIFHCKLYIALALMLSEKKTVIKQHWKMNKDSKTVYYAWICLDRCLVYIELCCIKFLSMILDCLIFNIVFSGFTKFSVQKWYEMYSTKSENLYLDLRI